VIGIERNNVGADGPDIGLYVQVGSALLFVLLAVAAWLARQQGREAKERRQIRDTNLAAMRWYYRVSTLAALRGWDTDPAWPVTPKELTAEYLAGATDQDPAGAIAQLAQAAQELGKGTGK
jgi:hypothetical protein